MFEQTLLTHPASARKTGALAASFLAQSAVIGVLLVGPLLYTQVLPMIQIPAPLWLPVERPVTPTPVAQVDSVAPGSSRTLGRVFVPRSIPTGPIRDTVVETGLDVLESTIVAPVVSIPGTGIPFLPAITTPATVAAAIVKPTPEIAKPILVSGGVLAAKLIKQVVPQYPTLARQTRVQGIVHLLGVVAKDGRIQNLRVIDGHPILRQAALDAVSQWVYSPTILSGQPVEVEAPIEVNFTLR
jgi:periplasmic protein TonB